MNTALTPFLNDSFTLRDQTVVFVTNDGLYDASLPESLLSAGAQVVLAGRDLPGLEREAKGLSATHSRAVFLDPTRRQSCREALASVIRRYGRVDVLINTLNAPDAARSTGLAPQAVLPHPAEASLSAPGPVARSESGLDDWQLGLSLGLAHAFFPSEVFGTQMARSGGGAIVNLAADCSTLTRAEVVDLALTTRYLAEYFSDAGVRVNALLRGSVTPNEKFPAFVGRYSELFPLGRMQRAEEAISALLYLAAAPSIHVSGRTLMLDAQPAEPRILERLLSSSQRTREN
jgi:NAD(P)-dependent dehydrogenase (short-subunit alcohol dehydrogenase family)